MNAHVTHPTPAETFDPVATWEAHAGTAYETQALRTIEEHARANGDTELAAVTGWLADLDQASRDGNTGDFEDIMDDYRDRAAEEAFRNVQHRAEMRKNPLRSWLED